LGGALFGGMIACDRNIAPFVPGEVPSQPDLSRIFPAPEASSPPGAPGMVANASSGRSGASVRGRVSLAPEASGRGGTLFIIARRQGMTAGPPLAVLRVTSPNFPLAFEIGPDQVMMPGTVFEGPIALTARLDGDGDAMTRDPADPSTASPFPVVPGTAGVELLLATSASPSPSPGRPAAPPPASAAGAADSVRGTVTLAASAEGRGGTLFVIARRQSVSRGPPLAVLRITSPSFPLAFEIGPDQVMMPGMRFEGPISLAARLDADGDAMTRDEADPKTPAPLSVTPGAQGVQLRLE